MFSVLHRAPADACRNEKDGVYDMLLQRSSRKILAGAILALVILGSSYLVVGHGQAPTGGVGAWEEDLAATWEFLGRDLSYSPAARDAAVALLDSLRAETGRLNHQQITAGLARLAALSGNAHTRAYLLRNRGWWRRYPIRIWRFVEGWYVVAARESQEDVLGVRLASIAGTPVEDAATAVRVLFAGNAGWSDYMAGYSLTSPDALIGLGLLSGDGTAQIVVEDEAGNQRTVAISPDSEPSPSSPRSQPEENWWFLSPHRSATREWRSVLAEDEHLPVYLQAVSSNYSLYRCDGDVLYFPFIRSQPDPAGEDIATFGTRLLREIEEQSPSQLIVDLRFNTGGDLTRAYPVFRQLAELREAQESGWLYVVIGPTTFSAGITHAVQLKQSTEALFVGTDPGDELDYWSEGGNVQLPHSGINMHFADRVHTYSVQPSTFSESLVYLDLSVSDMAPDLAAHWEWSSYRQGRDPFTEAAVDRSLTSCALITG